MMENVPLLLRTTSNNLIKSEVFTTSGLDTPDGILVAGGEQSFAFLNDQFKNIYKKYKNCHKYTFPWWKIASSWLLFWLIDLAKLYFWGWLSFVDVETDRLRSPLQFLCFLERAERRLGEFVWEEVAWFDCCLRTLTFLDRQIKTKHFIIFKMNIFLSKKDPYDNYAALAGHT